MQMLTQIMLGMLLSVAVIDHSNGQNVDTSKQAKDNSRHVYLIINVGTEINAFYNDKPVQASTIEEFNNYLQTNVKSLRDSWIILTGKPKTGTFDEVMKALKRNRFKHISTNFKD